MRGGGGGSSREGGRADSRRFAPPRLSSPGNYRALTCTPARHRGSGRPAQAATAPRGGAAAAPPPASASHRPPQPLSASHCSPQPLSSRLTTPTAASAPPSARLSLSPPSQPASAFPQVCRDLQLALKEPPAPVH